MKRAGIFVIILAVFVTGLRGQVRNVNVSGSYQGVFTLSGAAPEYSVSGSPYLTDNWMFGTLELKRALFSEAAVKEAADTLPNQNIEMIRKCNELIEQISDPEYRTIALKLLRAGNKHYNKRIFSAIELNENDFEDLPGMLEDFEEKLLAYLIELRDEYESGLTETNQINGLFRYNLYAQEFEMIYGKDTFAIKSPLDVQNISLSNKKFIYGFYIDREFGNDYLGSSYFEVLNDGSCKLLVRHDVKIRSQSGPVTHNWAGSESDSFVKIRQLYFQQADGMEVKQLKKNKKYLKMIFADKYFEVERYIKDERININDEKELIKVFTFYNNLNS